MAADADVVVIGAGLAGLTAAHRLTTAGASVVVVEARGRVGGRVLTTQLDDLTVDLGGTWVGPGQDRIAALLDELGVSTFPTHDHGDDLLVLRRHGGRVMRRRAAGRVPPLAAPAVLDLVRVQTALDRMARQVPLDRPWTAPRARSRDAQTLESWLQRNALTRDARRLVRLLLAQAVLTTEAENVSLLHVLFYLHAGGGFETLMSTTGGAQQDRIVGGALQVPLRLAGALGDRVRLDWPVRSVRARDDGVEVGGDAGTVTARRAIVAVPPTLAGRLHYEPALPAARDQLTQRVPHGATIKAVARYDRPFWRDDGLSGQALTDRGDVLFTFDVSPADGSVGALVAFVQGTTAVRLGAAPAAQRRAAVLADLAALYGPQAAEPDGYVEQDWQAEQYTRGCYGGHAPPGALTQYGHALRRPIGPLHWAGTETAERGNGYMDGAVASGERAAREVLAALG